MRYFQKTRQIIFLPFWWTFLNSRGFWLVDSKRGKIYNLIWRVYWNSTIFLFFWSTMHIYGLLNGFKRSLWLTHDSLGLASSIIFPLENDSCPNRVGGISKNLISLRDSECLTRISNEQFNLWSVAKNGPWWSSGLAQ